MHLYAAGLDSSMRFYAGVLGFEEGPMFSAFRMGEVGLDAQQPHVVAFNTWKGENIPPAPADALGMRYFTLVLPSAADIERLVERAQAAGMPVRFEFILYQPSISRARNLLSAMFLQSDCTHLLFIDADIDFSPDDVFSLIRAMDANAEVGVLGGAYPRRMINWRNVARAVELGLAKDNPAELVAASAGTVVLFSVASPARASRRSRGQ